MVVSDKSALDQLKEHTIIVADTGSLELIHKFNPTDVTTNPSLLLHAAASPAYVHLLDEAVKFARVHGKTDAERIDIAMDKLFVACGRDILKVIPGRVSTELDARLSFDTEGQVNKARHIIKYYEDEGVSKERILIKLSSTWEGIKAAEILERDFGIHCNMTLLFNYYQAVACAEAGVTLISPFVGRIYDWHVKNTEKKHFTMLEDPGVVNVTTIYDYYKKHGYKTQVMGASFRNTEQIKGLCGSDLLTISPTLLTQLAHDNSLVTVQLKFDPNRTPDPKPAVKLDEKNFRWHMNEDEMASDRLADGIRRFAADAIRLENILRQKLSAAA